MAIENRTSRRTYELEKCFLEKYFLSELRIFWSSLFQSIATEGKGEFWKKLSFTLNRGILLVFFVFYVITEVILILNKYFRHWYPKTLKMHNSFLYHLFFSRVSKPSSLYSFSLNVHPIALVIAITALHWIDSYFWVRCSIVCLILYGAITVEMRSNKGNTNCK